MTGEQFLHRFLQHVLPKGLQRVRHYGWLSATAKERFECIRALLDGQAPQPLPGPAAQNRQRQRREDANRAVNGRSEAGRLQKEKTRNGWKKTPGSFNP
ncbi:MAG TPA: transposase [Verrucomicrobiae bacterium]|nr:transposase [Verrucomicrobiae bacterium]